MDLIIILLSIAVVLRGADNLTNGAASIARRMKMTEMVIGLTVVAMGTSMPELCVSLTSAVNGTADMAVGNVVGSNVFNIFLIIGVCAMVHPLSVSMETIKRDLPFAFIATTALIVMLLDDVVTRIEGIILLAAFMAYMAYTLRKVREGKEDQQQDLQSLEDSENEAKEKGTTQGEGAEKRRNVIVKVLRNPYVLVVAGLLELAVGSSFFVDHATSLAQSLGISEAVIGITILGFGTSMPELATSLVAAVKGRTSMALGNVIGSCVFNILMIIGITAAIIPLETKDITMADLILLFAGAVLLWFFSFTKKTMERWEGGVLTAVFIGYMFFLLA